MSTDGSDIKVVDAVLHDRHTLESSDSPNRFRSIVTFSEVSLKRLSPCPKHEPTVSVTSQDPEHRKTYTYVDLTLV